MRYGVTLCYGEESGTRILDVHKVYSFGFLAIDLLLAALLR